MTGKFKEGFYQLPGVGIVRVMRIGHDLGCGAGVWFVTHYDAVNGRPIAAGVLLRREEWRRLTIAAVLSDNRDGG